MNERKPRIDKLIQDVGSSYLLVQLVARRAREIERQQAAEPEARHPKPVTVALQELGRDMAGRRES